MGYDLGKQLGCKALHGQALCGFLLRENGGIANWEIRFFPAIHENLKPKQRRKLEYQCSPISPVLLDLFLICSIPYCCNKGDTEHRFENSKISISL